MGQRANLVVVERGQRTLYYDHWCANSLHTELFWGPELALAFITARAPVAEPDWWLDTTWCEGAAILDLDRRVLTWFGGQDVPYDVLFRRTLLEMMAPQWPGWDIRWAHEGILSIADELGLPRAPFRGKPADVPTSGFSYNHEFPEDNSVAISIRLEDGALCLARLCGLAEELQAGPGVIDTALAHSAASPDIWAEMPLGGIHVDCARRHVDTWWAPTANDILEDMRVAWPGWTVSWHRDDLERHVELAERQIVLPAPCDLRPKLLTILGYAVDREARNPVRELVPRLAAEGRSVDHVNPATDIARGSVGNPEEKRALLAAIAQAIRSE